MGPEQPAPGEHDQEEEGEVDGREEHVRKEWPQVPRQIADVGRPYLMPPSDPLMGRVVSPHELAVPGALGRDLR